VHISGDLDVNGTKNFKIDHPLDPSGSYLKHAAVESSEVLNTYSGTVVLDEHGRATVPLADWFAEINTDPRYQLTAIGAAAPNLHISSEIDNNQFAIAGGSPGLKVSWMVITKRNDAYMQLHPFLVVEPKPGNEQGTYLCPECHGAPQSASTNDVLLAKIREQQPAVDD